MPYIELSITYMDIIDNDIDSHISYCRVEYANKKSVVARYFKLQTRSDVSRRN